MGANLKNQCRVQWPPLSICFCIFFLMLSCCLHFLAQELSSECVPFGMGVLMGSRSKNQSLDQWPSLCIHFSVFFLCTCMCLMPMGSQVCAFLLGCVLSWAPSQKTNVTSNDPQCVFVSVCFFLILSCGMCFLASVLSSACVPLGMVSFMGASLENQC